MSQGAPARSRFTGIEAGRGIAALIVMLMHLGVHFRQAYGASRWGAAFTFGHAGVDFFFVLSGFIITYVHAADVGRPGTIGRYLRRRFTRIFPLYWLVLALAALALALHHPLPPPADLAAAALLLPVPVDNPVSVAWTLQHEIVFYALFAVLILRRRLGLALLGLWLTLIVARQAAGDTAADPGDGALIPAASVFDGEFLLGMLAAWILRRARVPAPRLALLLGTALFFALGAAEDLGRVDPPASLTHLGYGLGAMLVVLGAVEAERQDRLRAPRLLAALGGASYTLYLIHLLTIGALWQVLLASGLAARLPPPVSFAAIALGCVAVALAFSRLVERPVTAFARRLVEPPPAARLTGAAGGGMGAPFPKP